MNITVDFSQSIAKAKKDKFLHRPFKSKGPKAFAVYAEAADGSVVRVDFDSNATDLNNPGPKYLPNHWASKVSKANTDGHDETPLLKLNTLSDFYLNDNVAPENRDTSLDEWDGKGWFSEEEILKNWPELKNVPPAFQHNLPLNKTANEASSVKPNSEPLAEQKKTTD